MLKPNISRGFIGTINSGRYTAEMPNRLRLEDLDSGLSCVLRKFTSSSNRSQAPQQHAYREFAVEVVFIDESDYGLAQWLPGVSLARSISLAPIDHTGSANREPSDLYKAPYSDYGHLMEVFRVPLLGEVPRSFSNGYLVRPYEAANEFRYQHLPQAELPPPV